MKKLSMLFVALTVGVGAWAQQQQPTSATTTKVNTDFSKYKTFAWAKADPTAVGPNGYDIYYYEITPGQPGQTNMNKDRDMNRDQTRRSDTYKKDETERARRDDSYGNKSTQTDKARR